VSPERRREKGTLLCRQLTDEIEAMAPPGIGRWERTWEIVATADSNFMIALTRWEQLGTEDTLPPLRSAYLAVRDAWTKAIAEYERQGAGR
jgi:hypothetical protein